MFNSVCTEWSTSWRRFGLLGGAQQMVFSLFPWESLLGDAGRSVHSSDFVVETNCPLQIIKELSTFENNFATEAVLEKCIQTVHVLVVETECIQFLSHSLTLPLIWCNICNCGGITVASDTIFFTHNIIFKCVCTNEAAVFEENFWKLGITCNITAAIWLLHSFVNKWIWKTRY